MKKFVMLIVATMGSIAAFAQNAVVKQGESTPAGAENSAYDLFAAIGIGAVAVFLFLIVYSLSKAVRVLALQEKSRS